MDLTLAVTLALSMTLALLALALVKLAETNWQRQGSQGCIIMVGPTYFQNFMFLFSKQIYSFVFYVLINFTPNDYPPHVFQKNPFSRNTIKRFPAFCCYWQIKLCPEVLSLTEHKVSSPDGQYTKGPDTRPSTDYCPDLGTDLNLDIDSILD